MNEGLVDYYLEKLNGSTNPPTTLLQFLVSALEIPSLDAFKNPYARLGRMVKLYGKNRVFSGIMEIAKNTELDLTKDILNLLQYVIKTMYEKERSGQDFNIDLTRYTAKKNKDPIKIGNPFDDD